MYGNLAGMWEMVGSVSEKTEGVAVLSPSLLHLEIESNEVFRDGCPCHSSQGT